MLKHIQHCVHSNEIGHCVNQADVHSSLCNDTSVAALDIHCPECPVLEHQIITCTVINAPKVEKITRGVIWDYKYYSKLPVHMVLILRSGYGAELHFWRNWKKCSGVLCDRRMPVKLKGKVYKTVMRPAMLWGRNVGYNEETRKTD